MARPLDVPNPNFVLAGTSIHGGFTTSALDLLGCLGASVTIASAGTTVTGTWQVWVSNFASPTTGNSVALTGAAATVSGAPGNVQLEFATKAHYAFLVFTDTGSTTDATASAATRTVSAGTV